MLDAQDSLRRAAESAIVLNNLLVKLLDAYDFYVQRYEPSDSDLDFRDLQEAIQELGVLPTLIAQRLRQWQNGEEPALDVLDFEVGVLNEFNVQIMAMSTFFHRRNVDFGEFTAERIGHALDTIRIVSRELS